MDTKRTRGFEDAFLKAFKGLNKTYLLKESFGQLWDEGNLTWEKFFEN